MREHAKRFEFEKAAKLRDTIKDGSEDNQDRVPFREQRKAVGHAVRAVGFGRRLDVLSRR